MYYITLVDTNFNPVNGSVFKHLKISSKQLLKMYRFVSNIKTLFAKHPLAANCVTYGTLYTGSEFLQQTIIRLSTYSFEIITHMLSLTELLMSIQRKVMTGEV